MFMLHSLLIIYKKKLKERKLLFHQEKWQRELNKPLYWKEEYQLNF